MKKIVFILTIVGAIIFSLNEATAANYKINDAAVDELFNSAQESDVMSLAAALEADSGMSLPLGSVAGVKEKDPAIAILLNFFFGGLGIHRFYLGTETMTGVGYILTCGGILGVVPLVDFFMLIINLDDISQFVDNPKFFMWS